MRILDRHVLTETATAGSAATGAFVFIMVAGNVLKDVIGAVATGRVSGGQGLEMIGLLFPGVIPYALPLGMLTGVLLAFGRMSSQHELTAMKASGRSLARIARPALIFAGALVLFSAGLNLELAPIANTEFRRLLVGSAKDNPSSIIVPGQLNRQFPGVIIRAGGREDEILKDFWLWRLDGRGQVVQTIHAQEARIVRAVNPAGVAILRVNLTDARMESRPPGDTAFSQPASFASAKASSLEFPATSIFKENGPVERKLRWLTTAELWDAMDTGWQVPPDAKADEIALRKMMVRTQFMSHLAGAFSIFSLCLLAVPLAVRVGRSETFVNAAVALGVALSYYMLTSAAAWVKDPAYHPDLLIWLPNIIVISTALWLLKRAGRH